MENFVISIYVNHFAPVKALESDIIKPIQVGASLSKVDLGFLRDDEGENISSRNPAYCEMTGVYWAWKNDHVSNVFGFLHYRRFFDFRPDRPRHMNNYGMTVYPSIDSEFVEEFGLTQGNIENIVSDYDIVVPQPFDVKNVGQSSLYEHYRTAPYHHIEDLELAERVVYELQPDYAHHFKVAIESSQLYANNMFLFTREVFEEYCEWIFPILDRLNTDIDVSSRSWQAARAVGYIAERLLTVFLLGQKAMNPQRRILELRRVFVENTAAEPVEPPLPQTDKPILTLVASCDEAYVAHLGTLLASVMRHVDTRFFVDFIVLDGGLSAGQRRLLNGMVAKSSDLALSFIDMRFVHLDLPVHSYFSRATFYRLSLPELLTSREKVLFLDTDMVVATDVSPLLEIDLEGALVAAVPDLVMRAFVRMGVRSIATTGGLTSSDYVSQYLGLLAEGKPAYERYFQAGTLVMNLGALRKSGLFPKAIKDLSTTVYWFLDQDILNKYLFGKVKFLDSCWNVLWMDDRHLSALGEEDKLIYSEAIRNPAIVHYAGIGKPWNNTFNPLGHFYWEHLRATPWYETILFGFLDQRYARPQPNAKSAPYLLGMLKRSTNRVGSKIWHGLPPALKVRIWPFADRMKRSLK